MQHRYAARLVPNVRVYTPAAGIYVVQTYETEKAFNICLHVACLPTHHGNKKSQK